MSHKEGDVKAGVYRRTKCIHRGIGEQHYRLGIAQELKCGQCDWKTAVKRMEQDGILRPFHGCIRQHLDNPEKELESISVWLTSSRELCTYLLCRFSELWGLILGVDLL